jgi:hypothetical protein
MSHSHADIPELNPAHVAGAKLYANRHDMIRHLGIPEGARIAEVGVANGDFTEFLRQLNPAHFIAADLFEMDRNPVIWGIPQEILFKGMGHYNYYKSRFSDDSSRMNIMRGPSQEVMGSLPDGTLDMIYIDAGHDYFNVAQDGIVCAKKISKNGILVFNDYVLYDPFTDDEYGVVKAVNEMIATDEWQVIGFALQRHMFCDIAIRRHQS